LVQLHDVTAHHEAQAEAVRALAARDLELGKATALQALLREQAMHDPLTGLLNRRALDERFAQVAAVDGPAAPPSLVLVLIDLDHFKRVNDTHGHPAGDAVLRDLAAALRSGLRASDTLFRLGGEEFGLLMTDTDADTAVRRTETLREIVARWRLGGLAEPITFSAGVATGRVGAQTLRGLMDAADAALYAAKRNGRNRTETSAA
jgi:diguanylate cyclase (GGDEF)-like protein